MIEALDSLSHEELTVDGVGTLYIYAVRGHEPEDVSEKDRLPESPNVWRQCPYCGAGTAGVYSRTSLIRKVDGLGGWCWYEYECGVMAAMRPSSYSERARAYVLGISERTGKCIYGSYYEDNNSKLADII